MTRVLRQRSAPALPIATAVVLAALVAMASVLGDGISGSRLGEAAQGRPSAALTLSGRTLGSAASAISSLADRLEEEWVGQHRNRSIGPAGGYDAGLALRAPSLGSAGPQTSDGAAPAATDRDRPVDPRTANHRRLLNLPPPASA
jgi:hypothetical protein